MQNISPIILVSPLEDNSAALWLQEYLAINCGAAKTTIWLPSQYADNLQQMTANQAIIFIGGPNGNIHTKKYIEAGALNIVTESNSFFLGKAHRKYFLCGKGEANSTLLATQHFAQFYAKDYIKSLNYSSI